MFKFLKKILKNEEELSEEVNLNNLENWFNEKTQTTFTELDNKISSIILKLDKEKEKTRENLKKLENAQLTNPKISLREKQFMEGNRYSYIKKVDVFLKQIELDNNDYDSLMNFCLSFDKTVNNFGKSTIKNYHILSEFFKHDADKIAENIRKIDNFVKEVNKIIKESNKDKIEETKNNIIELNKKRNQKTDLKQTIEKENLNLKELKKSKEETIKKITKFKTNKEYIALKELKQKEESLLKEIEFHNNLLSQSFSVLERALKKYSKIAFEYEKLTKKYLESSIKTLLEDSELKIINILQRIEKNIKENQIDLDKRKTEKTLVEIKKMNKEFFKEFLKKRQNLLEELNKIKEEIKQNTSEKTLYELNETLNKNELNLQKEEEDIENLKNNLEKIDIEKLKDNLKEEIREITKTSLVII